MNSNDHGRKEPSLSDLEAFEKLLRESLQDAPVAASPAEASAGAAPLSASDHDAMAELTRLIEQPLDFALPDMKPRPAPEPAPAPELHTHLEAAFTPNWDHPPVVQAQPAHAQEHSDAHSHALGAPLTPEPAPTPELAASHPPLHSVSVEDPLAAFEEELRRFDATRIALPEPAHPADLSHPAFEDEPPVAATRVERQQAEAAAFEAAQYSPDHFSAHTAPAYAPLHAPDRLPDPALDYAQPSALEAAEQRLAEEAAAAAPYAPEMSGGSDVQRSRSVFIALGGLAVAGLAVIGGSFVFGGGKKGPVTGDVPVIAAKTEPTKEKPADPGGVEVPNQNAQILTGRDVTKDIKPAEQVVNTTEQPLDLKEVTRRDSVRIIAPNPFQAPSTPTAMNAASGVKPAEVEPRRVTSVRVPVGGESAAPSSATGVAAAAGGAAIAAIAAGAAARASTAPPKVEGLRADAPKSEARPPKKAEPAKTTPPKTTPAKADTPKVANASATPKVKAPEKAAPRNPNAPMPLTDNKAKDSKAKAAPAASGTFAVQLASRPTEADAKAAAASLGSKYSGQLGGKGARVISGEANGTTVYRVRASGYSQAAATEVCNKIKAAGGACFIAKQ